MPVNPSGRQEARFRRRRAPVRLGGDRGEDYFAGFQPQDSGRAQAPATPSPSANGSTYERGPPSTSRNVFFTACSLGVFPPLSSHARRFPTLTAWRWFYPLVLPRCPLVLP